MASRPSRGRLPCAARPRVSIAAHANPLCPTPICRSVGSVTIAASALHFVTSVSAPRLAYSSSTTAATIRRPLRKPRSRASRAASIIAATPPFMSCEPRPYSRPSRSTGSNGAGMPSTPTVSMCPHSISVRPGSPPSSTPITFGRPGAASCISTPSPSPRMCTAMASAICASPAAPGTSDGLTESIETSSRSKAMHGSVII